MASCNKRIVFEMGWQIERVAVDAPAAPPATSSRASENELAHLRLSSFRTPPASAWAGIREQCTNHLDSGGSPATLPHANKIWMLYGFELFHTPAGRSQARSSSERRRNFSRQAILLVHSPIRPRRGQDGIPIESPNPLLFARNLGPLDRFKVCRRSVCVAMSAGNSIAPSTPNHDSFGNFCHVIRAPAGRLTLSADSLVHDNGEPDAIYPQAEQHDPQNLPVEALIYLLGSRIAKPTVCRIRLGPSSGKFRRDGARASDLRLRTRPHHVRLPVRQPNQNSARHNRPRIGRILMARGRDATDGAIVTSFGPCMLAGVRVFTEEVTSADSTSA